MIYYCHFAIEHIIEDSGQKYMGQVPAVSGKNLLLHLQRILIWGIARIKYIFFCVVSQLTSLVKI